MCLKFLLTLTLVLAAQEWQVLAGFGGPGGFGGFGGFNFLLIKQSVGKMNAARNEVTVCQKTTNTTILNNIAGAKSAIDAQVKAAEDAVSAAASDPQCASEHKAALASIDSATLDTCNQADQLDVKPALANFGKSWGLIIQGISTCPPGAASTTPGAAPTCPALDNAFVTVTDTKDAALATIAAARENSDKCIAIICKLANDAITAANNACDECGKSKSVS